MYQCIDTFLAANTFSDTFGPKFETIHMAISTQFFDQNSCDIDDFYQNWPWLWYRGALKIPFHVAKISNVVYLCQISQKVLEKVSVTAHRYIFWDRIFIGTDTFCGKVSVLAHRYILNVSTKGLNILFVHLVAFFL